MKALYVLPFMVVLLFVSNFGHTQDLNFKVSIIDSALLNKANAVVRSDISDVVLNGVESMIVKTKRAVTVLNKSGKDYANSLERYSPSARIKKIEITIYNAEGVEIKKYKKKDFSDRSAYDGFSIALDDRIKYVEYVPTDYPYTVFFESEVEHSSTLGIPSWYPISSYKLSVEKSIFNIINTQNITLRTKEENLEGFLIKKEQKQQCYTYRATNLTALTPEVLTPSINDIIPSVKIVPETFMLENVKGTASDWKAFGKWMYDELIKGRNYLPKETVDEVSDLVKNATNNREKAAIIYNYVQNKTRYISIQLGIGGWMPFRAKEVDQLGYGDCKALTNYTKALLDSQGITSYYTIVHAGDKIQNLDKDFASLQGNHAILNIPDEKEDIWLECTSQTTPFNFIAGFTDDRDVLVVTPNGGEIKHTKKYRYEDNSLHSIGTITIQEDGSISGGIEMKSKGIQYNERYDLASITDKNQKRHYKNYWKYINDLEILKIDHIEDKGAAVFTQKIDYSSQNYTKKAGSRLLINPNAFNRITYKLPKYKERKTSFRIARGFKDVDIYTIETGANYTLSNFPEKKEVHSKFGDYTWEVEKTDKNKIKFRREFIVKSGTYTKDEYFLYRDFLLKVKKQDAAKIILNTI